MIKHMWHEVIVFYIRTRAVKVSYAWNVVYMICYDTIAYLRRENLCFLNKANCIKITREIPTYIR